MWTFYNILHYFIAKTVSERLHFCVQIIGNKMQHFWNTFQVQYIDVKRLSYIDDICIYIYIYVCITKHIYIRLSKKAITYHPILRWQKICYSYYENTHFQEEPFFYFDCESGTDSHQRQIDRQRERERQIDRQRGELSVRMRELDSERKRGIEGQTESNNEREREIERRMQMQFFTREATSTVYIVRLYVRLCVYFNKQPDERSSLLRELVLDIKQYV